MGEPLPSAVTNRRTGKLATLKLRSDFLRVAASRQKAVMPGLVLQSAPAPVGGNNGSVRVGFTASRKVGNAVLRNRAKRKMRAAASSVLADRGRPGTDYVLIARASTPERPFAELLSDLAAALSRIERSAPRYSDRVRDRNEMRRGVR
ncbi:MAG: ribonuclease P protein component [Stellaceae bacterium]